MNGFFNMDEVITHSTDILCSTCRLDKGCRNPKMPVTGEGRLRTLIIAEAPGKMEDEKGTQLIGDVGQWLRKRLAKRGLHLDKDFWKTNAVACKPPNNREPFDNEIRACRSFIEKAIKDFKPEFIWLLGGSAIKSLFMDKFSNLTPTRWRGLCIPDFESGAWIIPMFHPSFALRNEDNPLIVSQFDRDLDFAIDCVKTKGSIYDLAVPDLDKVRVLKDFDDVCDCLEDLIDKPPKILFHDYETTGKKPYKTGHKIVSVSFITDESDTAYSFPLQHPHWTPLQQKRIEERWKKVLLLKSKKVAQGLKFEDVWARVILQTTPVNWHWCTMITAHILDNRKNITGLKFQAFMRWGIPDYSKEIAPFLKSEDERGFNRVMEAPLNKLLLYGGIDSLVLKWLYYAQIQEVDSHLEKGVDLFTEGSLALADIQINGINCDVDYYNKAHIELEDRIKTREAQLLNFDECKKFEEVTGRLPKLGSSDDLKLMFFDILKLKSTKKTDKGNDSVDKEVMSKLDTPLAKEITELSRIKKIDNTYISQFLREIDPDGRVHPFFDLGQVLTFRSCVAKGTLVHVVRNFIDHPNGVPIETVKKGDQVYCFDDHLKPSIRKVLWSGKTGHKKVIRLYWKSRSGKGHLDVTPEHLIRLTTGEYKPAEEFAKDKFYGIPLARMFNNHVIYKVEILPLSVDVYDLEVEEYNNFFANEICVHNSSSEPNFQNVPVRNEEAKRYARSGIIPSKGFKILDFDYAAIEVRMGACYTLDPVLIAYINDPSTDMHRDTTSDIFKLPAKKVTKDLRFYIKNGFVFPEWYGSYYKTCAKNIWASCSNLLTGDGISVYEHLKNEGVIAERGNPVDSFTNHLKKVEEKYWKKFKVFKEWQENWYKNYEKTGVVELLTGFRCSGYMGRNELINYPFQGTAFHCLLWSLIQINAYFCENKMESKVIAQIHDNGIIDCCPDEQKEVKEICTQIATKDIRDHFKWINVPLEVEWESGKINESWYSKNEEVKEEE